MSDKSRAVNSRTDSRPYAGDQSGAAPPLSGIILGGPWPRESAFRGTQFPVTDRRERGLQAPVQARDSGQMAMPREPVAARIPCIFP